MTRDKIFKYSNGKVILSMNIQLETLTLGYSNSHIDHFTFYVWRYACEKVVISCDILIILTNILKFATNKRYKNFRNNNRI